MRCYKYDSKFLYLHCNTTTLQPYANKTNYNMKHSKIFRSLKLALAAVLILSANAIYAQSPKLKFNAEGKFKIVQLTDIHWKYGNPKSDIAAERMIEVLDAEKPDLVVVTGDIVFAKPAAEGMKAALAPIIERGIPFAVTFGNHDDEHDLTRAQLLELAQGMKGNLSTTTEGITGTTNYTLPVISSKADSTAAMLYIFDSNSYSPNNRAKGYAWIAHDQIGWYMKQSAAYTAANGGKPLPALAFFHIPLPEFNEAVRNEGSLMVGTRKEAACSPKINSGLATAMLSAGDVMGVFVGHDHVNDYAVDWRGILLAYGRYSGGDTVYNDIPDGNGARVIELTEGSREFTTWIRIGGGRTINHTRYPADAK